MNKINAYIGRCSECSKHGAAHTINGERGEEMSICSNCGTIVLNQKFDVLRFLIDEIHSGVETEEGLREQLECVLLERYEELGWVDIETLADTIMQSLAEEAFYQAQAEDDEATADYYEREADYRSMVMGVC